MIKKVMLVAFQLIALRNEQTHRQTVQNQQKKRDRAVRSAERKKQT